MSYSFTARGKSKAEAKAAASAELEKVVEAQPIHKHDMQTAKNVAIDVIDLLPDDDDRDVMISVNGSIGDVDEVVFTVSVGVTASLVTREAE